MTTPDLERVQAIAQYDVLDHPPRRDLLALVDLAALVCGVPMATINLITADEQRQVATFGFDPAICRREDSMCASILDAGAPVVVDDASLDERFKENPFVTGELGRVRFYAAHQLRTHEGVLVGTLCVFDEQARRMSPDQAEALHTLADRVVDVLELELVSRRLSEANDRLTTSNERLGAFAGQVSHDLKNPLTAIAMSLEMARDELAELPGDESASLVSLLERASRGADRMQAMIGDLLAFAKGGGTPDLRPVDLGEVMEAVAEDLHCPAEQLEVADLPVVSGDPVQLRVLLQNLVANGLKFSRDDEPPRVRVSAVPAGTGWRVEVVDHGRGVPEEEREHVFEPFVRIDKAVPGSGIGLATSRRIVQAHGGRIGLDEAPGGGALVWFELPEPQAAV